MNDSFSYKNSAGELIQFGSLGLVIDENDLRDFAWSFSKQYERITNFTRDITKKKVKGKVYTKDLNSIKDSIYEIIEKDILTNKHGRIYINGYMLEGYFNSVKYSDYTTEGMTEIELGFVTDKPYWIKETTFRYRQNGSTQEDRGLDYPYDYPYDYASSINVGRVVNPSFVPSNFKLIIYGSAVNPLVSIGSQTYRVNVEIGANEFLTVDSYNKKVYLTNNRGIETNVFKYRDLEQGYIFEKIPAGESAMIVVPASDFDLILVEERSTPRWT